MSSHFHTLASPANLSSVSNTSQKMDLSSRQAGKHIDPEKAWKAAEEFETTFASHLLQQLFSGNDTGLFGGGQTEVLFRSFWTQAIAKSMTGTFGVADSVYPILLKQQGADHGK